VESASHGLILGKFLPPHLGHLRLVRAAMETVRRVTIVIGALPTEPIPGRLRLEWMRELCPGARVELLDEPMPREPRDHPEFWELWTRALRRFVPSGLTHVFTSEDYGDELAARLGARHVCVDRARADVPVSGTAIRKDPWGLGRYLPAVVRAHFVKRVVLTGAESTGKSTLARQLAERFSTEWVPEFARGYLEARGRFVQEGDLGPIAAGQIAAENEAARRANRVLFVDTDLHATVIYGIHYLGRCPSWIARLARRRTADLRLLCAPDIPFEPDWQRPAPHRREFFHAWFRGRLEADGCAYTEVRGVGAGRLDGAAAEVAVRFAIDDPGSPRPGSRSPAGR